MDPSFLPPLAATPADWQSPAAIIVVVVTALLFGVRWWKRRRSSKANGGMPCGSGQCGCAGNLKPGSKSR